MNNRHEGIITAWKDQKGFGFITPRSGGAHIFFHISNYSRKHKRPAQDLLVEYTPKTDEQGRTFAVKVLPLQKQTQIFRQKRQQTLSLLIILLFAIALFYLLYNKQVSYGIIWGYVVISAFTFVLYAKDKRAAQAGRWRTPEKALHTCSLLGGWPGAAVAQAFLRHKSHKLTFRMVYWVTVIVNCCALYWLSTPKGIVWSKTILYNLKNQLAG
ncbi:DUF1294 domain-containing protein [Desulfogranum japonicum]|uniref:DUF1294 domain-containing protein n=1 Tax=Desulfogranum japonicum TaxID=231447 RepID=UPI000421E2B0|nr:cold shock and DUF1294 domain-containing protein [Desulfogranum japonicum]